MEIKINEKLNNITWIYNNLNSVKKNYFIIYNHTSVADLEWICAPTKKCAAVKIETEIQ